MTNYKPTVLHVILVTMHSGGLAAATFLINTKQGQENNTL